MVVYLLGATFVLPRLFSERDLAEFLEVSLRDPDLMRYEPTSLPSGLCVINNDETSKVDLGCD